MPVRPGRQIATKSLAPARLCGVTSIAGRMIRDVTREVIANAAMGMPRVRRWRMARPRTVGPWTGNPELLERYAFQALRGIERYAGPLGGKTIVEFGPGDTLSAGLAMVAAGARRYVALDRFVSNCSSPQAKQWYDGVRAGWVGAFPGRTWPEDLNPATFPEGYSDQVGYLPVAVEETSTRERFDVVTSWQVGEHVSDIRAFAALTAHLMVPDGVAIHRVDFGPHDCWRGYPDPLTFLRIPSPIWNAMGSNRGTPNRARHHEIRHALESAGLDVACREVTEFPMDRTHVGRMRRMRTPYRGFPADSLRVKDVVYVCRHRAADSR